MKAGNLFIVYMCIGQKAFNGLAKYCLKTLEDAGSFGGTLPLLRKRSDPALCRYMLLLQVPAIGRIFLGILVDQLW